MKFYDEINFFFFPKLKLFDFKLGNKISFGKSTLLFPLFFTKHFQHIFFFLLSYFLFHNNNGGQFCDVCVFFSFFQQFKVNNINSFIIQHVYSFYIWFLNNSSKFLIEHVHVKNISFYKFIKTKMKFIYKIVLQWAINSCYCIVILDLLTLNTFS